MTRIKTLEDKISQEDLLTIFQCLPNNLSYETTFKGELLSFVSRILSFNDEIVPAHIKIDIRENTNVFKKSKNIESDDIQFNSLSELCADKISYKEALPNLIKFVDHNSDVNKLFKFLENILPEFPQFIEDSFANNSNTINTVTLLNAVCIIMKPKLKKFKGQAVPLLISDVVFNINSSMRDFSKVPAIFECISSCDPQHISVNTFINQVYACLADQKKFLIWLDENPEIKKQIEYPEPKAQTQVFNTQLTSTLIIKPEVISHQQNIPLPLIEKGCNLLIDFISKDLYLRTMNPVKKEKFSFYFEFTQSSFELSSINGKPMDSKLLESEAKQVKEIFELTHFLNHDIIKNLVNQYHKSSFPDQELRGKVINALKACQLENQILVNIQKIQEKNPTDEITPQSNSFKL